ncbi:MAG: CDC48 family AAA ATPase [Candidatus Diapherotrites archaeon]|nr:CDC48 family AAA ATPase [Candidatus Diapherotrites archaeon]
MPESREIVLKVEEADPTHVGRNIVMLDRVTKQSLDVTSGDIVEIEGSKRTAAVIWPARAEDEGKGVIRMDSYIRRNAGVGLGEKVSVRKAEVREAQKITLAPTQEVRIIASGYDRILKKSFLGRPVVRGDSVWVSAFGSGFVYKVIETAPKGIVKITDFTQLVLKDKPVKGELEGIPQVAYEDIGGLDEQITKVRELIELPMKHPEIFRKLGIIPPKGVLLFGPPGTGKTLLAKAVANETNAHFISVSSPSIMSKFVGEAEERIRDIFKEAEENAPSIIFFDEIDAIAPKRDEVIGEVERRVVAQILSLMDGLEARGNVVVIAATNRVNSIDEALRRPGRFDREIEFGVPDRNSRKNILQIHTRGMPLAKFFSHGNESKRRLSATEEKILDAFNSNSKFEKDELKRALREKELNARERDKAFDETYFPCLKTLVEEKLVKENDFDLDYYAGITHGFVGADLESLTKEAAMKALRRYLPKINLNEDTIPAELLESMEVMKRDFQDALKDVQPSALREITIEIPNVKWSQVGALDAVKAELMQAIEWPLKYPDVFKKMGIRPPTGVLLFGPPGTGKTLLAKAVATESEANFISVKGPELISKWVGESEKGIRQIFRKARQTAPVIVFFDEIDSIASRRGSVTDSGVTERVVNQLLTELDGVEALKNVVFIAATNRPDLIDQGLLRPGRIDKLIKVNAPDEKGRLAILKIHTRNVPLSKEVSLEAIAGQTRGFSGADLEGLVREAALISLDKNKMKAKQVLPEDFADALKKVRPSVNEETEEAYESFEDHYSDFRPSYVR